MTKLGKEVTRVVPGACLGKPRDLVVTVHKLGITFRAARRTSAFVLTWDEVLEKFDDLRKDLR